MFINERKNKFNIIIGLLFFSITLLFAVLGKRLNLSEEFLVSLDFYTGLIVLLVSVALVVGMIYGEIKKNKKLIPSKERQRLKEEFNFAEKDFNVFAKKLKRLNRFYNVYIVVITCLGCIGYLGCSFLLFVRFSVYFLLALAYLPAPIWRVLNLVLIKSQDREISSKINSDEFPETVEFIQNEVNNFWGEKVETVVYFGSNDLLTVEKYGKGIRVGVHTFAFFLLTKNEISALLYREISALKDKKINRLVKLLKSRTYVSNEISPIIGINSALFSFIIINTLTGFQFSKSAINRKIEKESDLLLKGTTYLDGYIKAYKKKSIFECYLEDERSFIYLTLYKRGEDLRYFTNFTFYRFLELFPLYGDCWTKQVENKLIAKVSDNLTYREKIENLDVENTQVEFKDNLTQEMKCIYDKFGVEYYEVTKQIYEAKVNQYQEFDREIMRYEQNPEDYSERLKLIGIAHAYYTLGDIDKTEEIYNKILEKDNSLESYFDYGAFLLTVKKDEKGVEYIYKAMENENLVDDGFSILGRYFILSGDENGYEKYSEYKENKMDKLVSEMQDRILEEKKPFSDITLDNLVLEEILENLSKDDNISEIYCADGKTRSGKTIYVFAISVRNKNRDAFFESYQRVFSILDNEYGKYDTFLLSVDNEKQRKSVKNITKNEKFLKFKR